MLSPTGLTPLTNCLQMAIDNNNRNELNERKLLILKFTDGSPTSTKNSKDPMREFKRALKYRQPINRIFVTI